MDSDNYLDRICAELFRRVQHIGIAIHRQRTRGSMKISGVYDLDRSDTPTIAETEYAFFHWNCAILTAFRGSKTLSSEENFERNIQRNEELKTKLSEANLIFRSVNGCYREAQWEKANVEICFFVTNTDGNIKDFFFKIYQLAEHYEQDSFLFTFPGANRVAFLIATNDDGRNYFSGDIKFAGPLFTHVPDIGDWTDCSDGRISFRLKGMVEMGGTGNVRLKIGLGDLFDVKAYGANGLVAIGRRSQGRMQGIRGYEGKIPLVSHEFVKDNQTEDNIRRVVMGCLNAILNGCAGGKRGKVIGLQCTASIDGSMVDGARVVYDAVRTWLTNKRHQSKVKKIVIVDNYFDYYQIVNGQ